MAVQKPVVAAEGPGRAEIYQPLSLLALAALLLAAVYALVITGLAVVAFASGTMMFLGLWSLVFPALAALLAYVARQQIRRSEGILSGMVLTTWALWLSVLFGLGYTAYYVATFLAISWQAERFTRKWFDKLRDGKVAEAFMDTREPAQRKIENPHDAEYMFNKYGPGASAGPRKGPLSAFQDRDIVWLLEKTRPEEVQIGFVGVKSWEYDKGGYQVVQTYRITRPEGTYDFVVGVKSSEGKEIEGRQWQVLAEKLGLADRDLNPLGETLESWRQQSRQFASEWVANKRNQGDCAGAFLDTLPGPERSARRREYAHGLLLAAFGAGSSAAWPALALVVEPEAACALYLPGFREYASGGQVQTQGFDARKREQADIIADIKNNFSRRSVVVMRLLDGRAHLRISDPDGATVVQLLHPLDLAVHPNGFELGQSPKYRCDAFLIVASDPGAVTNERQPRWRVAGVQLVRGGVPPAGPPQAGRGGGAPPPAR
jgi:hypothetical protein